MFRFRQHAGIMFAKDPITIARDHPVHRVTQNSGQDATGSRQLPNTPESLDDVENCIRAHEHTLFRFAIVNHDVERIEVVRVRPMPLEQRLGKFALQRGKEKPIMNIALQNKLDQAIAKSANAIVENNRFGFGFRQSGRRKTRRGRGVVFMEPCEGSFEFERIEVIVVSLIPVGHSLLRAG